MSSPRTTMYLLAAMATVAALALVGTAVAAPEPPVDGKPATTGAKVEGALERGAKATADGIERGAKAAAHGVQVGVSAAARGIARGAEATARAADTVARKVQPARPSPPAAAPASGT